MSLKKPIGAALAVGVVALMIGALPALASAATVTLHSGKSTGAKLAKGAAIKGLSKNLKFEAEGGLTLECAESEFTGEVTANAAAPAEASITGGAFRNAGGGAECATNNPEITADIALTGLPWTIHFFSDGTTTITGTPVVDFTATIRLNGTVIGVCDYEKTTVADTYNFGTALSDVLAGQVFTLNVGASVGSCPAQGTLSGTVAITSGGVAVVATTP